MIRPFPQDGIDAFTENVGRAGLGQEAITPSAAGVVGTLSVYVFCEDEDGKPASGVMTLQTRSQVEAVERSLQFDVGHDDVWLEFERDAIRIPRVRRLKSAAALLLEPLCIRFSLIA